MGWGSRILTHVETSEACAALTFDDGPHPVYTPQVLNILRKYGAKGTFFMVGEAARQYPDIVNEVARAGHVIGNHSWNHPYLPNMRSRPRRLKQLWDCARAISPHGQRLFRPPFGAQNPKILFDAFLFQYRVVLWNASAQDWTQQGSDSITEKIVARVKPGSIFLLHDGVYVDRDAKDIVIDRTPMIHGLEKALSLLQRQIKFVTVPELLKAGRPVHHWPIPEGH